MPDKRFQPPISVNRTPPPMRAEVVSSSLPHPLDAEWNVRVDDNIYGPFSGHDMKAMAEEGRLEHDSMVQRAHGPDRWFRASEDRTLARFFTPAPMPPLPRSASVNAREGSQVVTVNNTIAAAPAWLGERPVDKSPFFAAILSLLLVGVGQMYNGEFGKGFLMFIGCVLLWIVMLGWIINLWSIIDAYAVANRKHDAYTRWMDANAASARAVAGA